MRARYYSDLPQDDRYIGSVNDGEIELCVEPNTALPIVYSDKYIAVLNEPVRFPNGKKGTYLRLFNQSELDGDHGTVMLARYQSTYVLNYMFRHPTRKWELECPRGFAEIGLTSEENARREIEEELGVTVESLELIGTVCPNTGLLVTRASVFLVELSALPCREAIEKSLEAIRSYVFATKEELLDRIAGGDVRDAFTLSAVILALALGKM